jgi:D-alanyl-lipoteichoic acid acyltransferase DltB (MBOAT superfamily)
MITMLLGGFWHGANWNFVIWGGLHGLGLVTNHAAARVGVKELRDRSGRRVLSLTSWGATFLFVVLTWVFFRAANTGTAFVMLDSMGHALISPGPALSAFYGQSGVLLALAALISFLAPNSLAIERALASRGTTGLIAAAMAGAGAAACILASLAAPSASPFLYFTF